MRHCKKGQSDQQREYYGCYYAFTAGGGMGVLTLHTPRLQPPIRRRCTVRLLLRSLMLWLHLCTGGDLFSRPARGCVLARTASVAGCGWLCCGIASRLLDRHRVWLCAC